MPYALDARLARRPLPPPFDAALGTSGKARVLGVLDPERYITRGGGGGGGGGAMAIPTLKVDQHAASRIVVARKVRRPSLAERRGHLCGEARLTVPLPLR